MYNPYHINTISEKIQVESDIHKVVNFINKLFTTVSIEVQFNRKYTLMTFFDRPRKVEKLIDEQFINVKNLLESSTLISDTFSKYVKEIKSTKHISDIELLYKLKSIKDIFQKQAEIFDYHNISTFHGKSPFFTILNTKRTTIDYGNLILDEDNFSFIKKIYDIRRSLYLNLIEIVLTKIQSLNNSTKPKPKLKLTTKGKRSIVEFILAFGNDRINFEVENDYTEDLAMFLGIFFQFNKSEFSKYRNEIFRNSEFVNLIRLTKNFDSIKNIYRENKT